MRTALINDINNSMKEFEIGVHKIFVDIEKTRDFYSTLPKISENCICSDCTYYEEVILTLDIRFFDLLKRFGVDPTRQPNIIPDGLCSVGNPEEFERSYIGYYFVVGQIPNNTQAITKINQSETQYLIKKDEKVKIEYCISQFSVDKLIIEFYIAGLIK